MTTPNTPRLTEAIGSVITTQALAAGISADPDWVENPDDCMDGLFLPKYRNPFVVWEAIEWYSQGFTTSECGEKVGASADTVIGWMKRIGMPRRPHNVSLKVRLRRRNLMFTARAISQSRP